MLYAAIPSDFFINQIDYTVRYQQVADVREEFSATDLTTYSSYGNDSATIGYSSYEDAPDAPQWTTAISNRYLEIWWDYYNTPYVGPPELAFQVRDTEERDFLGFTYPAMIEACPLYIEGEFVGAWLDDTAMKTYGQRVNMSITAQGSYIRASLILKANGTDTTVYESWQNGEINYYLTWEIDFDAMKPSAWLLIGQLLTFQAPDWGVPGVFGEILSYVFALGFWAAIILITYTIITKLIPTIQGGVEN